MSNVADPYFNCAPVLVIWEMTRACALSCKHCRAEAIPYRNRGELSTNEAFALVAEIAAAGAHLLVLSGGDPLMRDDVYKIVEYGQTLGLKVAVSPSATGRLNAEALRRLYAAGAQSISLSLDAPDDANHDAFRGVRGSFDRTIRAAEEARRIGLDVQINTTLSRVNHEWIEEFVPLLTSLEVAIWTVFSLVPVGRATQESMLDARETEAAYARLYALSRIAPFPIKTTEAPSYRRYVAQQEPDRPQRPGVGDGRGFVFVSHVGEICPSGFLPLVAGNVRTAKLGDVYRDDPLFVRLRRPSTFSGKCGLCEFNRICGGSRARAYAVTGDPFGSDPSCSYQSEKLPANV